jgi:hypothetical protein
MAKEQALRSLEEADDNLRRAIAHLVAMRFDAPGCPRALSEAAGKLRRATSGDFSVIDRNELAAVVQRIRTHAARVQALLDSAAAFYCGWVSSAVTGPPSYTPDGQLLRDEGRGQVTLNV